MVDAQEDLRNNQSIESGLRKLGYPHTNECCCTIRDKISENLHVGQTKDQFYTLCVYPHLKTLSKLVALDKILVVPEYSTQCFR